MAIRKFRGIEEMDGDRWYRTLASKNALQESWADANFSAYQQRQKDELARPEGRGR
jgi:hypothetical protein